VSGKWGGINVCQFRMTPSSICSETWKREGIQNAQAVGIKMQPVEQYLKKRMYKHGLPCMEI